ncbi:uncharacterized protein LOC131066148 isoform X2 [Cryptomeria japonica]|uniref:uncharacterized protein LOC131066148 isoform X2 n=1 Tax=Cryptomeria japonica TaxID=3369 RepID=UPI0027DA3729|nr:uncharacterized protein LOC131066148 isoform X2 [Cryptomeria japonica]
MVIAMDMVASFRPCISLSSFPTQLSSLPIKSSLQHFNNAFRKSSQTLRNRRSITGIRCHTAADVAENVIDRTVCPPVKADLDITAFQAIDLRVGLIVDIGCEVRTVVSECKYVMDVEDAVGKKILFVANIAPQEVLGIKSHGLVLVGLNYDLTPMPRSLKVILPGLGRLPPGAQVLEALIPR